MFARCRCRPSLPKRNIMQLNDDFIITEAIRLVNEGREVIFPVKGNSMLPFIIGGSESAVFAPVTNIHKGGVYLAHVDDGRYVVHRVIGISGNRITLMGDGNLVGREYCTTDGIKAEINYIISAKGIKRCLNTFPRRLAALIWRILRPVRRWLLGVYRRIH